MIDLQQLVETDKQLLLAINGTHNLFWDGFMWIVTDTKTWIPAAAMLLYVIFKNNKLSSAILMLVMIALSITFADQFASGLCKPFFHRFRPTQDPDFMSMIHIVGGYRGGSYGFISSHAANTFAVATFVSLALKSRMFSIIMYIWAIIPSYSRMYLGVHYPGDIFCGAVAGTVIALLVYLLYAYLRRRFFVRPQYISDQYTRGGYELEDIRHLHTVLLLTYFYAMIGGMVAIETMNF